MDLRGRLTRASWLAWFAIALMTTIAGRLGAQPLDARLTAASLERVLGLEHASPEAWRALTDELDNAALAFTDLLFRVAAEAEVGGHVERAERFRSSAEHLAEVSAHGSRDTSAFEELLAFHQATTTETRREVAAIHALLFETLQRIGDPTLEAGEIEQRARAAGEMARRVGYRRAIAEAMYLEVSAHRLQRRSGLAPQFDEVEARIAEVGDDYLMLLASLSRGSWEFSLGELARAERAYERARALMSSAPAALRIESLTGGALSQSHQGRVEAGILLLREAFEQSRRPGAHALDQITLTGANLAQSLVLAGRVPEALDVCRQAEQGYRGQQEDYYYKLQRVKAYALFHAGRVEEAMSQLSGLIVIFGELGNQEQQAIARMQLGLMCFERGHYHAALFQFAQLESTLPEIELPSLEIARNDYHLGRVYDVLGKHEVARSYYERGLDRSQSRGATNLSMGIRRQLIRRALISGRVADLKAGLLELEAIEVDEVDRAEHESIRGELLANLGRDEEALTAFTRSLATATGALNQIKARINRTQILIKLGRLEEAEAALSKAGDPDVPEDELWSGIFGEVRARIHLRRGESDEAIESLERSAQGFDEIRSALSRTSDRLTFSAQLGLANEALVALCHDHPDTADRMERAFRASERGHARTLHDALRQGRVPYPAGERIATALRRIAHLRGGSTGAQRLVPDRGALTRALSELQEAADDPIQAPGSVFGAHPVSLAEAQALAARLDVEIFEYFLGDRRAFLLRVSADEVSFQELPPPAQIASEVQKLRACFDDLAAYRDLFVGSARRLGRALLPEGTWPERVVIVPHGSLFSLPFDVLLTDEPPADGPLPFLIRSSEITLAPSVSAFAALQSTTRRKAVHRALLVGDPIVADSTSTAPGRVATRRPVGRLDHAAREFEAAQSFFEPGSVASYRGIGATEASVKEHLEEAQEIHLVCHGSLDERSPLLSGLWFVPGAGQDGFLSVAEVQALETRADVVILSACVTARGHTVRWDGVHGLTRAFFLAGARRVVASLWGVEDAATADLMTRFYEHRRDGQDVSTALHRAKLELLEAGKEPVTWAGFIVQGASSRCADE